MERRTVWLNENILGTLMPREGQKLATEVARMARQHKGKGPNHRYVNWSFFFMVARPNGSK